MIKYSTIAIIAILSSCNYKAVDKAHNSTDYKKNTAVCECPVNIFSGTTTDTVFRLNNGKLIALCGYRNEETNPVNWSEFALAECGADSIIGFWGAPNTAEVKVKGDTLLVE